MRTVAIGLMIVYHVAYDVDYLSPDAGFDPREGWWRVLQVTCASTFLAVVGLSFWVRSQQLRVRGITGQAAWHLGVRRGGQVVAAAAIVSLATFLAMGGDDAVRFGILHCIAVAQLVVLPLVVRLGVWNVLLGAAVIAAGVALNDVDTDLTAALVVGLDPGQTGVDWVPLLPWLGPALVGLALGAVLYPGGERHRWLGGLARRPAWGGAAGAPGRHSLAIYLVHQPVLIALTAGVLLATGASVDGL